jgi:hypothetical protein
VRAPGLCPPTAPAASTPSKCTRPKGCSRTSASPSWCAPTRRRGW